VGGFITAKTIRDSYFAKRDKREYFSAFLSYGDVKSELPRKEISFPSGANELMGAIYGETETTGLVVFVHGFGGDMDVYIPQIQFFVQRGWRVLAYDGTGVNDSGGDSLVSLCQAVADLRNALTFIENDAELSRLPLVLAGHSQGGFAVCSVLNYEESAPVKAVVSFAGINRAGDGISVIGEQTVGALYPILKPFAYVMNYADFSSDKTINAVNGINKANIPVMLVQGIGDTNVPPDKSAITRYASDITNPNVEIIMLTDYYNNEHMSILWSKEAYDYRADINKTLGTYRSARGITALTDADLHAWAAEVGLDRAKMNAINMDLFEQIDVFFKKAVS
jgi:pimeloyl-ACP methyl ester carboxylesterase